VFSLLTVRAASTFPLPFVSDVIALVTRDQTERKDQYVRDNVLAMTRKLGEVQAELLRLDVLGERVAKAAGIRPEEFRFRELPARGGAPGSAMTFTDLDSELRGLTRSVEQRADYLAVVEAELRAQQVRNALLPGSQPVADGFIGSGFGWRTDPFSGEMTRHDGIDFAAPAGTPIHAAAGGVVVLAEQHPIWGNVVEIDHGNGLMTRYAHASRLMVSAGALVKRGHKIAEVGTTGRSTGPHLHFEVHSHGVAQNPAKFLFADASPVQQPGSRGRVDLRALANAGAARN
jgi:murein DD-endopeptidase MepM/ murein hydrolase activator NlpD